MKTKSAQAEANTRYREKKRNVKRTPRLKGSAPARSVEGFSRPPAGDPEAWLLAYLPAAYPHPFGPVHRDIVASVMWALRTGGNVAIAAPRGTGKSTLVNGLVLYALLEGLTPFPVVVPWDDKAKRRALRFWAGELCFNSRLHRDYPDHTAVFKASRGHANRLASVLENGESTGARLGITEGVIVLPRSLGAIGSATINGNPRGLNYAAHDGRIIRPSLAVVDDPQDRETARSRSRVLETIDRINGDVAGMAGPDALMPIVMSCTVIERDDVAEHYLSQPDWRALRVGQVTAWPAGWADKGSETRRLWEEWNGIRQEDDTGGEALAYYARNRESLTRGMAVSWEARYDAKRGQPDAYYAAMADYYVMGEDAFAAERQNAPIKRGVTLYDLNPGVILTRVDAGRTAGVIPPWAVLRTAATDINPSYGLTWGVCAFGQDQTAAVLGYGVDPMGTAPGATEAEVARAIYESLVAHGRKLAALPCRPETWVIDAGGAAFDVVLRFAAESARVCGVQAIGATGRGARNYKPFGKGIVGKPREQCHMAVDAKGRKWLAWNADYWKECAQKGWTGSLGAPGSCSLPAGNHRDFAEQVCREQLAAKAEMAGAMRWEWHTAPGPHDYGDVMAMCYMAAAWGGVGTSGPELKPAATKARVVIGRPSARGFR